MNQSKTIFCFGNFCNTSVVPPNPLIHPEFPEPKKQNPVKTILSNCKIHDFSPWGTKDIPFEFTIEAANESNIKQEYGGDIFRVIIKESGIKGHVIDKKDGTYRVTISPPHDGPIELSIMLLTEEDNQLPITLKTTIFSSNFKKR